MHSSRKAAKASSWANVGQGELAGNTSIIRTQACVVFSLLPQRGYRHDHHAVGASVGKRGEAADHDEDARRLGARLGLYGSFHLEQRCGGGVYLVGAELDLKRTPSAVGRQRNKPLQYAMYQGI